MYDDLLEKAYLAGIIDADGFISAHRKRHKNVVYCGPLIGIAGTSREPHDLAKKMWGGSVFVYTPKNKTHRIQYQWQAVGIAAATAIKDIAPFLRIKIKQANLALGMWDLIETGIHRTDDRLAAMADQLSAMNLRNPPKKPTPKKGSIPDDMMVREFPDG